MPVSNLRANRLAKAKAMRKNRGQNDDNDDGEDVNTSVQPRRTGRSSGGGVSSSSSPSSNDAEVKRIEVSAAMTFAAIFFLLSIGASLATSYIMIHKPGCMSSSTKSTTTTTTTASNNLRSTTPATTGAVLTQKPPVAPPPPPAVTPKITKEGFPPQCTNEQMTKVREQLPSMHCFEQPYSQACSLTVATAKGCPDNSWVRNIYSQMKVGDDDKFRAIFTGNACGLHEWVMDVLAIGSHDATKFDRNKYAMGTAGVNCRKPVTLATPTQPAMAVCINPDGTVTAQVKNARSIAGLTENELKEVRADLTARDSAMTKTLDKVVEEVGLTGKPIHYLHVKGNDNDVIMGATNTLSQIRYLEFEYHWMFSWEHGRMSELVNKKLAAHNFVCYWNGGEHGVWRMTDCWQSHYDQKWWAQVACVSSVHEDSKPILAKMEEEFAATLARGVKYGA